MWLSVKSAPRWSIRHVLRWATARSTAARILLKATLNSVWHSSSLPAARRLTGTISMPSTPTYPRSAAAWIPARMSFRPEASKAKASCRAMDSKWPDRGDIAVKCRCDLDIHAGHVLFPGEQVRDVLPVPGRRDRAVYQRGPGADDFVRGWDEPRDRLSDDGPEQVPSAARRPLAPAQSGPRHRPDWITARQVHPHRDRSEQT